MLYIIVMIVYANGGLAFNEFSIDSIDEIDMLFWEEFMLKSRNINAIATYIQDEQNRDKYNYHDFCGYTYIDNKSFITEYNFTYTYHGEEIDS